MRDRASRHSKALIVAALLTGSASGLLMPYCFGLDAVLLDRP